MEGPISNFLELKRFYEKFDRFEDVTQDNIDHALRLANRTKQLIASEALFSRNEEISDVITEHIPLLLTSFYHGSILLRQTDMQHRKDTVSFAQANFEDFLEQLDSYRILNSELRKIWKKCEHAEITRDEKVSQHKRKNEVRQTIQSIHSSDGDLREAYLLELEIASIDAVNQLYSIKLELQMLEIRQTNPEPPIRAAPTRPTILQVTPENAHLLPSVISSSADITLAQQRMKEQVFQPGHALPTMTIEEYGEWEYQQMMERQRQEEQKKQEPQEDSEDEEVEERKRKKQADWDDWKDVHEKGAGNRMGR